MQGRLLCVLLIAAVGCKSWRTIPLDEVHERVEPGDYVRVSTKDGDKLSFVVARVTSTMLAGESYSVLLADVEKLQVRRISVVKTGLAGAGWVAAYVILTGIVTAAVFAAAF